MTKPSVFISNLFLYNQPMSPLIKILNTHKYLLAILFFTFLAYANTLTADFVWDDHSFITEWPLIQEFEIEQLLAGAQPELHQGVYRPIRNILYAISYQFYGSNPFWYHLQAVTLHLFITFSLYQLINRLTSNQTLSLLTTLIFGLHPIHTEAVAWITTSFDIFGILFLLISFNTFLTSYTKTSFFFAFLAFFTYEMTLVFPLLIMLYLILLKHQPLKKTIIQTKPIWIIFALYWVMRFSVIGSFGRETQLLDSQSQKILLILQIIAKYIWLLIWPLNLNINHHLSVNIPALFFLDHNPATTIFIPLFHPLILLSIFTLITVILTIYFSYRRNPLLAYSLSWLIISLLPVSQLIPQPIIFAEKYAYLASIGFSLTAALIILKICNSQKYFHKLKVVVMISIVISTSLALRTFTRNQSWFNDQSLWIQAYNQNPNSASINGSLGGVHFLNGQPHQALPYLQRAVELNPHVTIYKRQLADIYESLDQWQQAIEVYQTLIQDYPDAKNVLHRLARAHTQLSDYQQAQIYYQRIIELDPSDSEARQKQVLLQTY